MTKQALCVALACLVLNLVCVAPAAASPKPEADAKFAAKVKREIARLGTGPDARVEVKLRDKTRLVGYVSDAGEEHFAVTDARTGGATVVAYPQVKQVKGHNLTKGARIALGFVFVAAVIVVIALVLNKAGADD